MNLPRLLMAWAEPHAAAADPYKRHRHMVLLRATLRYCEGIQSLVNRDLVISVNTAVARVVGALDKPVWLLNRFDTDWR